MDNVELFDIHKYEEDKNIVPCCLFELEKEETLLILTKFSVIIALRSGLNFGPAGCYIAQKRKLYSELVLRRYIPVISM